ncbi:MAG: hypothetical protein WBI07_04490 [Mobilitalea sp.]
MKKALTLLLCTTLVVSMMTGCGKKEEAAKTGLAVISSISSSKDAGEEDGLAQVDSTIVAVLVSKDGKILDCKIDMAQTKVNFTAEGALVTDIATEFMTKQELGANYGMKAASAIGKEWNEQADAIAAYVIGKTTDEVSGIAINEEGLASDADLAASVTIHLGGFIAAITKAVANAQDLGASNTDKLGLGVTTNIAKSTAATAEAEGLAQAYSMYSVVTTDKDAKITSSYVDASQSNVNFSTVGVVTSDLTATLQTKQELKDAYGMKAASAIGKEWYEQANAFSTFVVGKTADEVGGIAITDEGIASDADLAASVSVHVGPFMAVVQKAAVNSAK